NKWKAWRNSEIYPLKSEYLPSKQRADMPNLPSKKRVVPTLQIEGPSISRRAINNSLETPRNTLPEVPCSKSAAGNTRFSGVIAVQSLEYMELFDRAMARRASNAA